MRTMKGKHAGCLLLTLLAVMALMIGSAQPRTAMADDGPWVLNPANGHYYKVIGPMTWMDAEAQAVAWGGHLATVNDAAESLWLQEQFGSDDFSASFVIGYNDREDEGTWVWSSGQTPGYTDWCPYEPNDDPPGEDVARMEGYPYDAPDRYCWNDLPDSYFYMAVVERSPLVIDIKPGSDPNSINLRSKGVVPVAVLTTHEFDATTVDPVTVMFAGAAPLRWAMEDVDYDGDLDLVFHFKTQELDLDEYSTEATLTGATFGGLDVEGTDTVNIVP